MTIRLLIFLLRAAGHVFFIGITLYAAGAVYYWLGWPDWLRTGGAVILAVACLVVWFAPWSHRPGRRVVCLSCLAVLFVAYFTKAPVDRTWDPRHEKRVTAEIDGNVITLSNFRDAVHRIGEPAQVRWTTRTVDLGQLESAELIMQPFGSLKALEHVMMSFRFADGRHVAVSVEARRVAGGKFDALAGFFRHDELYPVIGTERDILGKRLAQRPPAEMQIYPLKASPEALRTYFRRIVDLANQIDESPQFYSTISDSCMTTLVKLAPEVFDTVPITDIRRWIPGYSLGLLQDLGLIDNSLPPDRNAEKHRLRSGVASPEDFPDDPSWSAALRGVEQ